MSEYIKIYCYYYIEYYTFKKWIEKYYPSLLYLVKIYESREDWDKCINDKKYSSNEICDDNLVCNCPNYLVKRLFWHCPIPFIREELKIRGYKTRWFHKLFFKY